jgi:hypothetical protein
MRLLKDLGGLEQHVRGDGEAERLDLPLSVAPKSERRVVLPPARASLGTSPEPTGSLTLV